MNLSRNDLLLVNALRFCLGTDGIDEVTGLSDSDWEGLFTNAVEHGMSAFLWSHISPHANSLEIPRQVAGKFAGSYVRCAGRGVMVRNQLASLLQIFAKIKIPVIVLKGSYLADRIYKDFSIRPMTDIDILINPNDALNVENALLRSGYKAVKSTLEPISSNHYIYKPENNGVRVEVHINLQSKDDHRPFELTRVWERSEAVTIVGQPARTLSLEDSITYNCYHQSKHFLKHFGLRSLYDLALLLKTNSSAIDWNLLALRAGEWHALNGVHISMKLAASYFHINVPQSFLSNIACPKSRLPACESFNLEIFGSKKSNNAPRSVREAPSVINMIDSLKNGSLPTLFFRSVFPAKGRMMRRYSSAIYSRPIIYFYAINFKSLIVRYSILLWKMIIRNSELRSQVESHLRKRHWLKAR